jgi:hypothetical protein
MAKAAPTVVHLELGTRTLYVLLDHTNGVGYPFNDPARARANAIELAADPATFAAQHSGGVDIYAVATGGLP